MRIPFDLIAALLCIDSIGRQLLLTGGPAQSLSTGEALATWGAFLLASWLLHEWITRRVEWRCRFGHSAAGLPGQRHPLTIHTWLLVATQFITVGMFAGVLWITEWPIRAMYWPEWIGLGIQARIGNLELSQSVAVSTFINILPYLLAMVASWIPRRRLSSGIRRRPIPLWSYVVNEAKFTWLSLLLSLALGVVFDAIQILPKEYLVWRNIPGVAFVGPLAFLIFISYVAMPMLIIRLWSCKPLPEGELRNRLVSMMERSGVKARAILVWGPENSGLLNACILGPWSRFRYVLISPALVNELTMDETEAVLGHELGHARHGHLTLMFTMFLCMAVIAPPFWEAIASMLPEVWARSPLLEAGVILAFILAYILGFFGMVMRRCEREADLTSAELMGTPQPLISALEKLGRISGNSREVYCWIHGSIAQRVATVERLFIDPVRGGRLHAEQRRLRIVLTTVTIAAIALQFWTHGMNGSQEPEDPVRSALREAQSRTSFGVGR